MIRLSWLNHADQVTQDDYAQGPLPLPIPTDLGYGVYSRLDLPLGFSFLRADHHFHPSAAGRVIPITEVSIDYGEPRFVVQSLRKGRVFQQEMNPTITLMIEPGRDLFGHALARHSLPSVEGSMSCEMVAMSVPIRVLDLMVGEADRHRLMIQLGVENLSSISVRPMPRHVSGMLFNTFKPGLRGAIQDLATQGRALEYLSALMDCCSIPTLHESDHPSMFEKVTRLRLHLLSLEGKLPTLEQLALQYRASARRLNAEFAKVHGQSILSFITQHRLEQARLALQETDIPMKALAARLGFSHVNYFITVFKRRFGYTPGALRRR